MTKTYSQTAAAKQDAEAHALKILNERLWHFTSVGLGNCRAAQRVRREIEHHQNRSGTGVPPVSSLNRTDADARATIEQLAAGLSHLESTGLANSRSAQIVRSELSRRLVMHGALLTNDDFDPNESRDRKGQWTAGGNSVASATNSPTQSVARGSAANQKDNDDDTDDIPLTYGGAHAKLRQSQSDASAQLYNKSGGEMKAVAAGGRAAAEMNPIVAFFHGIYQFFAGKDAIDSKKQLTTSEKWKSLGSAAMAAAPTALKTGQVVKDVVEAGEAVQGVRKAEGAIAAAERASQEVKKTEDAGAAAAKAAKDAEDPLHHIATDKNLISTARGGPWTPKFEALFKKAGMTLQDGMNKISVAGHYGPHPEEYHRIVFKRLEDATEGLSGDSYTKAFKAALTKIADEAKTPGTELNKLLTE